MRVTPGFRLKAKFVVHAVGPMWRGGDDGEPALLAAAYRNALLAADAAAARSIAFPSISTGVYGYPRRAAAETAFASVRRTLPELGAIGRIVLCTHDRETEAIYRDLLG